MPARGYGKVTLPRVFAARGDACDALRDTRDEIVLLQLLGGVKVMGWDGRRLRVRVKAGSAPHG